jgi:hypothetical protein
MSPKSLNFGLLLPITINWLVNGHFRNLLFDGRRNAMTRHGNDRIIREAATNNRGGMSQRTAFVSQWYRGKYEDRGYTHCLVFLVLTIHNDPIVYQIVKYYIYVR